MKSKERNCLLITASVILLVAVVIDLRRIIPIKLDQFHIEWDVLGLVMIAAVIILYSLTKSKEKFDKQVFLKQLKGYISFLVSAVSAVLLGVVLFTKYHFNPYFVAAVFVVTFMLYYLSEELKK